MTLAARGGDQKSRSEPRLPMSPVLREKKSPKDPGGAGKAKKRAPAAKKGSPAKPKAAPRARKAARRTPTKLTPERTAEFAAALRRGESIEAGSDLIGVSSRTVRGWMARGIKEPDGMYGAFARAAAAARDDQSREPVSEDDLVRILEGAAKQGSIRAAQWLLERQWPERWATASRIAKAKEKDDEPSDPFGELDELAPRRANRP